MLEFGLDALVADRRAFINAPRSFLVEGVGFALPKDRVVVEILENVSCEPDVVSAVEALAIAGYPVALDDFVFRDELKALLPYSTIVKLGVSAFDEAALELAVVVDLAASAWQIPLVEIDHSSGIEDVRDPGRGRRRRLTIAGKRSDLISRMRNGNSRRCRSEIQDRPWPIRC